MNVDELEYLLSYFLKSFTKIRLNSIDKMKTYDISVPAISTNVRSELFEKAKNCLKKQKNRYKD
jgi:hypothetical protein